MLRPYAGTQHTSARKARVDPRPNMKRIILPILALAASLSLTSCQTAATDENPPIQPTGSGGRGMSPGQHAKTNSADSR